MTADPKKDNEIKDEDLNKVAGGVGSVDDEKTDGAAGGDGGGDGGGTDTTEPTGPQSFRKV